jgi:hypothetical protein
VWNARDPLRYIDLLNQPPNYSFGETDWSYGSKKRSQGMPIEFSGIYNGTKSDIDTNTHLSEDYYIAVYRKGNLLWGVPPDWRKFYGNTIDTVKTAVPVSNTLENSIIKRKPVVKILSGNKQHGFTIMSDVPLKDALIVNTAGKVLNKKSFSETGNSKIFNVPWVLYSGVYFVEMKFNNGDQLTKKVIVKN